MSNTALDELLALVPNLHTADPSAIVEAVQRVGAGNVALALLPRLSPSGTLDEIAEGNPELDRLLADFDAEEQAIAHLRDPAIVDVLEDDFASAVPILADASVPLTAWAIPLLSALAGPCAPLLSFGLTIAVKVALAALKAWAAKRLAARR